MAKLRDVQKELRPHGIVVKKTGEGNEHRVNFHKGHESTAYYASDLDDARDTGHAMHKRAEELRMKGQGSHDPMYTHQQKNK